MRSTNQKRTGALTVRRARPRPLAILMLGIGLTLFGCSTDDTTDLGSSEDSSDLLTTTTTTTTEATTTTRPAPTTTEDPLADLTPAERQQLEDYLNPPTTTTTTTTAPPPPAPSCDSNYSGCVPIASDVDCAGGSGDGPAYTGYTTVIGSDIYGLDSDGDGQACE